MIFDWWDRGYLRNLNALVGEQFLTEASVLLPGIGETPTKGSSQNKCIKYLRYWGELYSSILRGTNRDEY